MRETRLPDKVIILDTLDMTPYLQMSDIWIKSEWQKNMRPTIWPSEIYLPRTPGVSTTEIAKKIRKPTEDEIS